MESKYCVGQWKDCPEATTPSLCKKYRDCSIEIQCMQEWLNIENK